MIPAVKGAVVDVGVTTALETVVGTEYCAGKEKGTVIEVGDAVKVVENIQGGS